MKNENMQNNSTQGESEDLETNVPPFVFFGGPEISVDFLNTLESAGVVPKMIVTTPDRPSGRKMTLTSPPLRDWAEERDIEVLQPEKFNPIKDELQGYELFVVVAYGKIIPKFILDIPEYGSLNVHPSLLPKYRGPSPILSALLADEKETGVSLMQLDEKMDHGPLLAIQPYAVSEWLDNRNMEKLFAGIGADMFLNTINDYISGDLVPTEQDHDSATECLKFEKKDMELDLSEHRKSYLKYLAFPKPFFFDKETRIIVTEAEYTNDEFVIKKVIPAGKRETDWHQYLSSKQSS